MKLVRKAANVFDGTSNFLAFLAGAAIIALMLVTIYEVVMRYFLQQPTRWTMEITEYGLLYFTFLGTAWVLRRHGHVRNDLLINRLKPRSKALLNSITSFAGAIICAILTWFGAYVTWKAIQLGYVFDTSLRPPQFTVLIVIPLGSFMLSIQFLRDSWGYLRGWTASPYEEISLFSVDKISEVESMAQEQASGHLSDSEKGD